MDRNFLVVAIFALLLAFLIGWLVSEIWQEFLWFDRDLIGIVLGGLLAGLFGLAAAAYSAAASATSRKQDEHERSKAAIQGLITKLIDFNDRFQKNYRHFMTLDLSSRVYFGEDEESSFSKPLEGIGKHIEFSMEERLYVLNRLKGAGFNRLSDIQGISENFTFLHGEHRDAFYALIAEVQTDSTRDGYLIQGGVRIDSPNLMKVMDLDGALRSLLVGAQKPVRDFLIELIEFDNQEFDGKLEYHQLDLSPSAENVLRADY